MTPLYLYFPKNLTYKLRVLFDYGLSYSLALILQEACSSTAHKSQSFRNMLNTELKTLLSNSVTVITLLT
jgi:hypothetical protein